MQSFLDEIAHATDQDPVQFRLDLLARAEDVAFDDDTIFRSGRMAGVLKLAAQEAGWGATLPDGMGRGIAAHFTFSSYCAWVVDVKMARDGSFRVTRAVGAIDSQTNRLSRSQARKRVTRENFFGRRQRIASVPNRSSTF